MTWLRALHSMQVEENLQMEKEIQLGLVRFFLHQHAKWSRCIHEGWRFPGMFRVSATISNFPERTLTIRGFWFMFRACKPNPSAPLMMIRRVTVQVVSMIDEASNQTWNPIHFSFPYKEKASNQTSNPSSSSSLWFYEVEIPSIIFNMVKHT